MHVYIAQLATNSHQVSQWSQPSYHCTRYPLLHSSSCIPRIHRVTLGQLPHLDTTLIMLLSCLSVLLVWMWSLMFGRRTLNLVRGLRFNNSSVGVTPVTEWGVFLYWNKPLAWVGVSVNASYCLFSRFQHVSVMFASGSALCVLLPRWTMDDTEVPL